MNTVDEIKELEDDVNIKSIKKDVNDIKNVNDDKIKKRPNTKIKNL